MTLLEECHTQALDGAGVKGQRRGQSHRALEPVSETRGRDQDKTETRSRSSQIAAASQDPHCCRQLLVSLSGLHSVSGPIRDSGAPPVRPLWAIPLMELKAFGGPSSPVSRATGGGDVDAAAAYRA